MLVLEPVEVLVFRVVDAFFDVGRPHMIDHDNGAGSGHGQDPRA
jgi:hypothetical protein